MRHTIPLALGAALVASMLTTVAAQTTYPAPKTQTQEPSHPAKSAEMKTTTMNPDHHFVMEAAGGGMAEVELGQLAADKASNATVKAFGQQMVSDHGKAGDDLKSLAASKNITLPTALNMTQIVMK